METRFMPAVSYICLSILLTCSFFLVFAFFPTASAGVSAASPPSIEVGLSLRGDQVEISFGDTYELINKATGEPLPVQPGSFLLQSSADGIRVQGENGDSEVYSGPLLLQPLEKNAAEDYFLLHNASNGSRYRGALEVRKEGGGLVAVNAVDLESYLRGVLPREMPASWGNYGGMEALKAQAVAARSYALYNQSKVRHSGYHLCDTEHCQVYGGMDREAANTDRAIAQTRGEVLTYDRRIIAPFYHASNAGHTECSANVWGSKLPYLKSRPDPYDDPSNPLGLENMIVHHHAFWETSIPMGGVEELLQTKGYPISGRVDNILVASTFSSGRVNELRIECSDGSSIPLHKEQARTVLGLRSQMYTVNSEAAVSTWMAGISAGREVKEMYSSLEGKAVLSGGGSRSTLQGQSFTAVSRGGARTAVPSLSFFFEGQGWGHGVGMSQNGAYNRSREGHSYRDILSFYYPGAELSGGNGW